MIELDRNIGHKSVTSINEFFIDRDELYHQVYQYIHEMDKLFAADLSVDGAAEIWV